MEGCEGFEQPILRGVTDLAVEFKRSITSSLSHIRTGQMRYMSGVAGRENGPFAISSPRVSPDISLSGIILSTRTDQSRMEPLTRVRAGSRHGHFQNCFPSVSSTKPDRSTALKKSAQRDRQGLNTLMRY